jgi:hypothetical protein
MYGQPMWEVGLFLPTAVLRIEDSIDKKQLKIK